MAGLCDLIFDSSQSALPHVESKEVRALGVTSATRMASLPDVPAIADVLPGYEAIAWNGLNAPAGTPPDVIAALNREVLKAIADPGVIARFAALGATCRPTTPEQYGAYEANEIVKWGKVVHDAGAKVD